ncbi:MAG TPA: BMP family ABC transporter substrate-binding protein [Syntrophomonas sp.]|nr:BMP family ABC transporter substrate-binding protein [Syntrophomonas sp.]
MKFKKLGYIILLVVSLAVMVVGCSNSSDQQESNKEAEKERFKVGFVYIGTPGDAGWTYTHDQGRKYLAKELPEVETIYLENVAEGADAERSIDQLAQKGCKVIFTIGLGDGTIEVAKKYPDVVFMHASGVKTADNVGTYFGKIEQMRYLTGIVAGKMTKSNVLGYVAAYDIPEVVRGINAFALGAQSVNPDVKVKVIWTHDWLDANLAKQAAKSLIEDGADVITQHVDTTAPQIAAEEAKVWAIGYHSDMKTYAPNYSLTASVWNWGPYYVDVVKSVMNKTWKTGAYWGGADSGVIDLAPISSKVPADVTKLVAAKQADLKSGKLDIFAGPLTAQDGTVKVQAGQTMTDEEMLSFNWFVKGVDGKRGQ